MKTEIIHKILLKTTTTINNRKNVLLAIFVLFQILLIPTPVYASENTGGVAQWNVTLMFILDWVPRLGSMLLFGGAIEYAIAYQSDNASQKTQASRLMLSGGMVIGISWSLRNLIYIQ